MYVHCLFRIILIITRSVWICIYTITNVNTVYAEIFAVQYANTIFTVIFSLTTHSEFSRIAYSMQVFAVFVLPNLMHYFQPQNDRLALPIYISPRFKNNVKMHDITQGTQPLNSDAILPQSNHVGISWIPIFTFAKPTISLSQLSLASQLLLYM